MLTFYLSCYAAIMLATFIPQTQPFLLNEVLQLETSRQGVVSGNLNFWGEIVIIATVGLWGSLSDRIGRRWVTGLGFVLIAAGIFLYGLTRDLNGLLFARIIYSAGIAAVSTMLITLMADYASDSSRGKATGLLGVMNGLGAMTAALFLLRLPAMYQGQGMNAEQAAWATYTTMTVIVALIAAAMFLGLKGGVAKRLEASPPLLRQLREGVGEARRPVIALAYAASFVARGNLAVVGTFYTLWASIYGASVLGMTSAEAVSKGGGLLAISYGASLLSAPLFGIMSDRLRRVSALAISLAIGAVGYGSTWFLDSPFSGAAIVCLVLIGMAEVGCIITSGVLIAEQAPDRLRGSVVGIFTLAGAVGILIASVVGGYLFDHWLNTGPFVFFGLVAALVCAWALVLRLQPEAQPAPAATA
ncbi:MFS transporter [Parahaliea maris]|uniref:MFS transporter n=2 Tax=Parahaliea maris TaxID=2716870 RepID=A0A5C9A9M1_9GAMM|nr:MFS transporter [Parahaliea maris]